LVNDRLDVALACGADGAHLPDDGLPIAEARALAPPGFLLGASAHGADDALAKARAGADLVTLGPIWDTPSKAGYGPPLGLEPLRRAAAGLGAGTALFAIGGVDSPARASEARRAGAHGVAVIRAAVGAADPGAASRALLEAGA
jgi:thiamine-phosphate pyrophosphorylase